MNLIDAKERALAIDPSQSFIVQAPAGSGKTELLTQRFLTLLSVAEKNPEEILAITFTRKAASEMSLRIIKALESPTSELAKCVLAKSDALGWDLLNNPSRLRIQTIDAFSSYLSAGLPLLSQLGASVKLADNANADYEEAAANVINLLETNDPISKDIAVLLAHLNNDIVGLKELFITMLSHRDQWLPYVIHAINQDDLRKQLETTLTKIVNLHLKKLSKTFPESYKNITTLEEWLEVIDGLLTKDNQFRKRVEQPVDDLYLLRATRMLPAPHYHNNEWAVLTALLKTLRRITAELLLIFQSRGHIDFIENSQRALDALGRLDEPSDLALYLDHKIKHILVDEFQDTSITQFKLLELLTHGWQPDDGRTLFLVGDPMQSIYRFRGATVGLFLKTKREGLGQLHLTPLTLSTNFRSSQLLVDWFNATFKNIFPNFEDINTGAIAYTASQALSSEVQNTKIVAYQHDPESFNDEAKTIASIIKASPFERSKIAILVKSRTHLAHIIPVLKVENIAYQGIEIEYFSELPIIEDLLALTKALLHFGDRIAWLSILRAPWCGLILADLLIISTPQDKTVWEVLNDPEIQTQLSEDGRVRVQRVLAVLSEVFQDRGKQTFSDWGYRIWLNLGSATVLKSAQSIEHVENFFQVLANIEKTDRQINIPHLERTLEKSFANASASGDCVQIMTIHKAKGLEFDVVILPSLERQVAHDKDKLLLWQERPSSNQHFEFLLAPIKEHAKEKQPIYEYLKSIEKQKAEHETTRLLYVAATRAKKELHLLASFDESKEPKGKSFLGKLFNSINSFVKPEYQDNKIIVHGNKLYRIATCRAEAGSAKAERATAEEHNIPVWEEDLHQKIGTVFHALLYCLSCIEPAEWQAIKPYTIENLCRFYAVSPEHTQEILNKVLKGLSIISQSTRALWILNQHHEQAASEYALSGLVIDRTFIEQGTRWIIDYKTSSPAENESLENFLLREKSHYTLQLHKYAECFSHEPHPIKLGLYFPMIDGWVEWIYK